MLVSSKIFPQVVNKIEKLKLSLSKQRNKALKMRFEMLKTRKKGKAIKLGKTSRKIYPEIYRIPEIPRIFGIPEISQDFRKFFFKFSVTGKLKIREKRKLY